MESCETKYGEGFFDKDTELTWLKYQKENSELEYIYKINELERIVDSWSKDFLIDEYVTDGRSLISMLHAYMGDLNNLFFAFEKENPVGVVFMCDAVNNYPYATIEYIVTNPKCRFKGIGTRMVSSIKHNPKMFTTNNYQGKIIAHVRGDNKASEKVMIKNKFKLVKKTSPIQSVILGHIFNQFYYDEAENQSEK